MFVCVCVCVCARLYECEYNENFDNVWIDDG